MIKALILGSLAASVSAGADIQVYYVNGMGRHSRDRCIRQQLEEMDVQPHRYGSLQFERCNYDFGNCLEEQGFGDCVKGGMDWDSLGTHGSKAGDDWKRHFAVVSNWCSHKRLFSQLAETNDSSNKYYLVLEDDVVLDQQHFKQMVADFIAHYQGKFHDSWEMVQIDPFGEQCDQHQVGSFRGLIWKPVDVNKKGGLQCSQYWGFHAILVRGSALKNIVENMETHKTVPLDWLAAQLPNSIAWKPGIARNPEEKNIAGGEKKNIPLPEYCDAEVKRTTIGFFQKSREGSLLQGISTGDLHKMEQETVQDDSADLSRNRPGVQWRLKVAEKRSLLQQTRTEGEKSEVTAGVGTIVDEKGVEWRKATTTRYWDCSFQHCTHHVSETDAGKQQCPKPRFHDTDTLSCNNVENNDAVKCADSRLGLFEHEGELYGTAAASSTVGVSDGDSPACGKCYELAVNKGANQNQTLTLMVTNWCPECKEGVAPLGKDSGYFHFDIAVPGGGQGLAPSCKRQFPQLKAEDWETVPAWKDIENAPPKPQWHHPKVWTEDSHKKAKERNLKEWTAYKDTMLKLKAEYDVNRTAAAIQGCGRLPSTHQESCKLWYTTFGDQNLAVNFREVRCPAVLHSLMCM